MKPKLSTLILLVFVLAPGLSLAATATTTLPVSITVQATCLASSSSLPLDSYIAGRWTIESVISVTCSGPAGYTVGVAQLGPGKGMVSYLPRREDGAAMQTHGFKSKSQIDPNLNNVTSDLNASQLARRNVPAAPSGHSLIVLVTY